MRLSVGLKRNDKFLFNILACVMYSQYAVLVDGYEWTIRLVRLTAIQLEQPAGMQSTGSVSVPTLGHRG